MVVSGALLWSLALALLALALNACAIVRSNPPIRIALLAPFEGRYSEVGYNALYAARLAVRDSGNPRLDLLAVDDGGTVESAVSRARALAQDPLVLGAVVLGYEATRPETQQALADLPVLVVGHWSARRVTEFVLMLSNPALDDLITTPDSMPVTAVDDATMLTGGEVLALAQVRQLASSLSTITVLSSASPPDSDFRERFQGNDPFAPEPGLLATLTYDAVAMIIRALDPQNPSRSNVLNALTTMAFQGFNGTIRFQNGFWADAPIHRYQYDAQGNLELADVPD